MKGLSLTSRKKQFSAIAGGDTHNGGDLFLSFRNSIESSKMEYPESRILHESVPAGNRALECIE